MTPYHADEQVTLHHGDAPDVGLSGDELDTPLTEDNGLAGVPCFHGQTCSGDGPDCEAAHARDLAALRERAEVAEAKVAAVEGLVVQWERDRRGYPSTLQGRYAETAVKLCERELTAALADRPVGGEGR